MRNNPGLGIMALIPHAELEAPVFSGGQLRSVLVFRFRLNSATSKTCCSSAGLSLVSTLHNPLCSPVCAAGYDPVPPFPSRSSIPLHVQLHPVGGKMRDPVFDRDILHVDVDVFDPQHRLLPIDVEPLSGV
jgi:hypothetical protein